MEKALELAELAFSAALGAFAMRSIFALMITYWISDGVLIWKGRRYRIDEIGRRRDR